MAREFFQNPLLDSTEEKQSKLSLSELTLSDLNLTQTKEPADISALIGNDLALAFAEVRDRTVKEIRSVALDGTTVTRKPDGTTSTERTDGSVVTCKANRLESVVYPDGRRRDFEYSDESDQPSKITMTFPSKVDRIAWTREGKDSWKSDAGQEFRSEDRTTRSGDYIYKDSKSGVTAILKSDGSVLTKSAKGQLTEIKYADGRQSSFEWHETSGKLNAATLRDGTKLQRDGEHWRVLVPAPGMTRENQKITFKFSGNGDVSFRDEKGAERTYRVNGDVRTQTAHGADVNCANGSQVIELDRDSKSRLIRHAGGALVELGKDGNAVSVRTADGAWRKQGDEWLFRKSGPGSTEVAFKGRVKADQNGNVRIDGEDKIRTVYRADGTRLREFPDGDIRSELKQRDRSLIVVLKDGRQQHVLADGSKTEIGLDGRTSAVVDSTGKKWELGYDKDGRLNQVKVGDETWTRPKGNTLWRNEEGRKVELLSIMPLERVAAVFMQKPSDLMKFRRDSLALDGRLAEHPATKDKRAEIRRRFDEQIARLLTTGDREKTVNGDGERVRARLATEDRTLLAKQIMNHAAYPNRTDQGYHGTCSVSTVETRLYTRQPDMVAKLITDVALTGSYKSADGTFYQYGPNDPTLRKDGDGSTRTLASQLFVVTAVNLFWTNKDTNPDGEKIPKGSLRYEQRRIDRGKKNGGECLVDTKTDKVFTDWSAINISRVYEMSRHITGRDERFAIAHVTRGKFDDVVGYETKNELRENLIRMKREKLLPASTSVNTSSRFFGASSLANATMHAVSIVDFDERTNTVMVDNQWGEAADHLGLPGTARRLTLDEFYEATLWKEPEKDKEKKEKPVPKDR